MKTKTKQKLITAFSKITEGHSVFTRRMAITLAYRFAMKPKFLILRFEELGLLHRGAWDWFEANGGITSAQKKEVLAAPMPEREGGT